MRRRVAQFTCALGLPEKRISRAKSIPLVGTEMAKCRYCGSEYYSTADRCYACGRSDIPSGRQHGFMLRRCSILAVGLIFLTMGLLIADFCAGRVDTTDPALLKRDWRFLAALGMAIASAGAATMASSLFAVEIPTWKMRQGTRSPNVVASAFMYLGVMAIAFEVCLFNWMSSLEMTTYPRTWFLVLFCVSVFLILVGYIRRPIRLFLDEDELTPHSRSRSLIGRGVLMSGVVLQTGTLAYALTVQRDAPALYVLLLLLVGLILDITGYSCLNPQGRPWIPRGGLR